MFETCCNTSKMSYTKNETLANISNPQYRVAMHSGSLIIFYMLSNPGIPFSPSQLQVTRLVLEKVFCSYTNVMLFPQEAKSNHLMVLKYVVTNISFTTLVTVINPNSWHQGDFFLCYKIVFSVFKNLLWKYIK